MHPDPGARLELRRVGREVERDASTGVGLEHVVNSARPRPVLDSDLELALEISDPLDEGAYGARQAGANAGGQGHVHHRARVGLQDGTEKLLACRREASELMPQAHAL